ncbi:MAG: PEGA domain-containing protein [Deltaproteobacteria bacterium]|nr:PEGA domain-containing protein [Deltaproteobacteria bacterium]
MAVFFFLFSASSPLVARQRNADSVQRMIDEGKRLFREKRYEQALSLFQVALERSKEPRPAVVYVIGRCQEELGRLEEAVASYESFLSMKAPRGAKAKARTAIEKLKKELAASARGVIELRVKPEGARISVDGRFVGRSPCAPIPVEPGVHEVAVEADGHVRAVERVEVSRGGRREMVVALGRELSPEPERPPEIRPTSGAEPPAAVEPPTPQVESASAAADLGLWTWVSLGTGGALVVAASIAYGLGEADHRKILDAEGYGSGGVVDMTQQEAEALEQSGDRKKLAGYVLWGVGGAALAAAVVLFVLDAGDEPADRVRFGASPAPGGGALVIGGRF